MCGLRFRGGLLSKFSSVFVVWPSSNFALKHETVGQSHGNNPTMLQMGEENITVIIDTKESSCLAHIIGLFYIIII